MNQAFRKPNPLKITGLILLATQHSQDQLINREGTQRTQKESE